VNEVLKRQLEELSALMAQAHAVAQPYNTQIQALEVARDDATSALTWQIDTLKACIREYIMNEKRSIKTDTLHISYVGKETWDNAQLRAFAKEYPTVLQCLRDSSYATFRYRANEKS
jgi:hypothetical protein